MCTYHKVFLKVTAAYALYASFFDEWKRSNEGSDWVIIVAFKKKFYDGKKVFHFFLFLYLQTKMWKVCGNNNITYRSKCHLMRDSCNTGFLISVKHEGPCRSWYIFIMLLDRKRVHIGNGKEVK